MIKKENELVSLNNYILISKIFLFEYINLCSNYVYYANKDPPIPPRKLQIFPPIKESTHALASN